MKYNGDYQQYLQSKHWKDLAEETRRLAGYRCQVCNSEDRLEIHHRTYERKGDEYQSDLVCLCHECHSAFHIRQKNPLYIFVNWDYFNNLNNLIHTLCDEVTINQWFKFRMNVACMDGDGMDSLNYYRDKALEAYKCQENKNG